VNAGERALESSGAADLRLRRRDELTPMAWRQRAKAALGRRRDCADRPEPGGFPMRAWRAIDELGGHASKQSLASDSSWLIAGPCSPQL